jgi:hypothetical protein
MFAIYQPEKFGRLGMILAANATATWLSVVIISHPNHIRSLLSMRWFQRTFTGKPHIYWENLWFPVDFPLSQSIDIRVGCVSPLSVSSCWIPLAIQEHNKK